MTREEIKLVKMTNQEAIEILRDTPIDLRSPREDDIHTLYAKAQMMAIEALSQPPREEVVLEDMPILETDNIFIPPDCKLFEKKRCPKCGLVKHFIDGHTTHYKYCSQCGSKIKWGGIND